MKVSVFLSVVLMTLSQSAMAWELSDVSVLIPMPKTDKQTVQLLRAEDKGAAGALIPASVIAKLPKLVYNISNQDTFKTYLRVLGVRFDPCFNEANTSVICRKQLRLIWQPIKMSKGVLVTLDAPVHTFYDFDDAGFNSLMKDYADLVRANPIDNHPKTLGINPRIQKQGFGGAFHKGLQSLILKYAGSQNFSRVTLMSVHPGDNEWNFLGFDIVNGQMQPIQIARINKPLQMVKTRVPKNFDLTATVNPIGFSKSAQALYFDSLAAKPKTSSNDLDAFAKDILHIENPRASHTGNVDCASCHLAGPGAEWVRQNMKNVKWQEMAEQGGWTSKRDLTNTTMEFLRPRRMRAFGYFYADPLIAQRTINETAEVADHLDQSHPNQ